MDSEFGILPSVILKQPVQNLHTPILFFFLVGFVKAPRLPTMPAACLFFICLWLIKPQMWVGGRNSALCFLSDKYRHQLHTYGSY